jgi:hypothetical protein
MDVPTTTAAEIPAKVSRVWRVVLIVVAVQALLVALGTVAFSALGFADQGNGCGGG